MVCGDKVSLFYFLFFIILLALLFVSVLRSCILASLAIELSAHEMLSSYAPVVSSSTGLTKWFYLLTSGS